MIAVPGLLQEKNVEEESGRWKAKKRPLRERERDFFLTGQHTKIQGQGSSRPQYLAGFGVNNPP